MRSIPNVQFEKMREGLGRLRNTALALRSVDLFRALQEKTTMKMREKTITAVCRTIDGVEWSSWKIKPDGTEMVQQDGVPMEFSGDTAKDIAASIELPESVIEHLTGDITVPMRIAELLMRIMEFPSVDEEEITGMVRFQIDKISPYPQEHLAISHEILRQNEDTSLVLMVAAKRNCIDAVGDTFEDKGIRVHGIDARVLGWMRLLKDGGHMSPDTCEVFLIDDEIDFSLVVVDSGVPVSFYMLDTREITAQTAGALAGEIGYVLTSLDTERDLTAPAAIQIWNFNSLRAGVCDTLSATTGLAVHQYRLTTLPPLSEGIVRRTLHNKSRIELVPREWIEHEKRMQLRRQFTLIASSIVAVWLVVLLIFFSAYKIRHYQLRRSEKRLAAIAPEAQQAIENRQKLRALKVYTDRSSSALECLREVTEQLPPGNIEFGSYNYKKGKGVTLRGSAGNDEAVYDFFDALTDSMLFNQLKDQSVNAKTIKGVRTVVFNLSLDLPAEEESK